MLNQKTQKHSHVGFHFYKACFLNQLNNNKWLRNTYFLKNHVKRKNDKYNIHKITLRKMRKNGIGK